MHRIVGWQEKDGSVYAITKGDNNSSADPFLVPVSRIYGQVGAAAPKAGYLLAFLQSPPGFNLCVICPLALLFLYMIAMWYLDSSRTKKGVLALPVIPATR